MFEQSRRGEPLKATTHDLMQSIGIHGCPRPAKEKISWKASKAKFLEQNKQSLYEFTISYKAELLKFVYLFFDWKRNSNPQPHRC